MGGLQWKQVWMRDNGGMHIPQCTCVGTVADAEMLPFPSARGENKRAGACTETERGLEKEAERKEASAQSSQSKPSRLFWPREEGPDAISSSTRRSATHNNTQLAKATATLFCASYQIPIAGVPRAWHHWMSGQGEHLCSSTEPSPSSHPSFWGSFSVLLRNPYPYLRAMGYHTLHYLPSHRPTVPPVWRLATV